MIIPSIHSAHNEMIDIEKLSDGGTGATRSKVRAHPPGGRRTQARRAAITAQLVNVTDGFQLWSERYDREMEDIFAVQDEIARSIADRLKVTLKGDQHQPLVNAGTDHLEAYQLYLKGRALFYQRGRGLPRSLECFNPTGSPGIHRGHVIYDERNARIG